MGLCNFLLYKARIGRESTYDMREKQDLTKQANGRLGMYGYVPLEHKIVSSELKIDDDDRFEIERYNAFVQKISEKGAYCTYVFYARRWEIVCDKLNKDEVQCPEQEVVKSIGDLHEMNSQHFNCDYEPEDLYDKNWTEGLGAWIRRREQTREIRGPVTVIMRGGLIMI